MMALLTVRQSRHSSLRTVPGVDVQGNTQVGSTRVTWVDVVKKTSSAVSKNSTVEPPAHNTVGDVTGDVTKDQRRESSLINNKRSTNNLELGNTII